MKKSMLIKAWVIPILFLALVYNCQKKEQLPFQIKPEPIFTINQLQYQTVKELLSIKIASQT